MKPLSSKKLVFLMLLVFMTVSCATTSHRPSNKWRIEVSEGANSNGEIVFRVSPEDREPMEVRVFVEDGTRENKVARTIRDAFEDQLPVDQYHVEVDDGEDVLVNKKRGASDFGLMLISSTVKSVRINLDRE